MRKSAIFILLSLLVLFGCSSENVKKDGDAIINVGDLSDFEESFIDIMNGQSFVYDVEINNDKVKEMHASVDYYENGEFVRSIIDFTKEIDDKEPIRTVFMRQILDEDYQHWISAIITDNGSASSSVGGNDLEGIVVKMESAVWGGLNAPTPLFVGEKKVVAHIIESDKDAVSSMNNIETEEDLKNILDYEQVYLISIELK